MKKSNTAILLILRDYLIPHRIEKGVVEVQAKDCAKGEKNSQAEAEKDTQRLGWLERRCEAYGFEDIHEGNRWLIEGPYRTIRIAIDAAMAGTGSDESKKGEGNGK